MDRDTRRAVDVAVGDYRARLRSHLAAIYLIGSHADGTAMALSDIDLFVILADDSTMTHLTASNIENTLRHDYPRMDSIMHATVNGLSSPGWRRWAPVVKYGSALLYGEDVRPQIELPQFPDFMVDAANEYRRKLAVVHHLKGAVTHPLVFPGNDEFCGFVRPAREWTGVDRWTHDFAVIIAHGAGAIAAMETHTIPCSRSDAHAMFARAGPEEWREYVAGVDRDCRTRWGYRIPEDRSDVATLRTYCESALDFENECLARLDAWVRDQST